MNPASKSNTIDVRVPHSLGKTEAKRRLQAGFGDAKTKASNLAGGKATIDERWDGDRMTFEVGAMGQTLTGWADVEEDAVHVYVVLPKLLAAVAGKLKDTIRPMIEKKTRDVLKLPPAE